MLTRFEIVNNKIDSLEKRIPMMEKLTELEIRIARLEKEKTSSIISFYFNKFSN